jgi:hypothetical protein
VRGCALLLRIVRRRHSRLVSLRLKFADTGFECTGAYKNDVEAALASAIRLYATEHLGK